MEYKVYYETLLDNSNPVLHVMKVTWKENELLSRMLLEKFADRYQFTQNSIKISLNGHEVMDIITDNNNLKEHFNIKKIIPSSSS